MFVLVTNYVNISADHTNSALTSTAWCCNTGWCIVLSLW